MKWHFVEYSNALWREAWQTEDRLQYQKWASGWNSIAHVQDWLAVKILKQNTVIENDCIFVPGHSGDFVAGSHIPDIAFQEKALNLIDSCQATLSRHYSLAPRSEFEVGEAFWLNKIKENMEFEDYSSNVRFADSFEKWDWQERQAKFICNSVRVYEFYGYDWWMPLWDMEFVQFWQDVPLELRKGREWYLEYVKAQYSEHSEDDSEKSLDNASDDVGVKAFLKSTFLYRNKALNGIMRKSLSILRYLRPAQSQLAFEGRYPREEYIALITSGYDSNGVAAYYFLKGVKDVS